MLQDSQLETEVISLIWMGRMLASVTSPTVSNTCETTKRSTPTRLTSMRTLSRRASTGCWYVAEMNELEFTGDPSEVERLNQLDTNDAALRTAWDAVLALRDTCVRAAVVSARKGLPHYIATPRATGLYPAIW